MVQLGFMYSVKMSVSSFISNRLSLRDGRNRKFSPAIIVAIAGVAMAFFVMMLSIAVVGGFKSEITRKIMGFDAQISIMPLQAFYGTDNTGMTYEEGIKQAVKDARARCGINNSLSVALSVSETGMLKTADNFQGLEFRAFGEGFDDAFMKSVLKEGRLVTDSVPNGIVISQKTADRLGLSIDDKVDAYFIKDGVVRPRRFQVTGIYSSGFGDYDEAIVFAPYVTIAKLHGFDAWRGDRMEISGLDVGAIAPFAHELQSALMDAYGDGRISEAMAVNSVLTTGAAYFNWLALLDTNVVVILILMGCVSGFMLITCVIILILQRVRMVGILKSVGACDSQIRGIFMRLGARVIFSGLAIGNVLGLLVIWIQARWHLLPLDPESYYLTSVPVGFNIWSWLALNAGIIVLSYALMLLPAGMISRLSPVKILRFE